MGCGKSFTGRALAKALNWHFTDMDDYLEEQENRSIKTIFATDGEQGFRQLERKYLKEILEKEEKIVISAGGGAPCFFDNIQVMNEKAVSIFLKTPVSVLVERLRKETAHRPLLVGMTEEELSIFIEQKLEKREKYYEQANVIYCTEKSNEDVTEEILKYFGHRLGIP